jgi:predicted transcriptional regulator
MLQGRREIVVDYKKLKEVIDDSGMTMVAISAKSGILRATLYNKLAGNGEFTASEIEGLSDALKLTSGQRNSIFFAKQVE